MSADHSDIPELRQLLQLLLERLDPALRAAAGASSGEPGPCQQVWCPVCAVAALINGEQHPLLGVIAEHSATLLAMLRVMAADPPPPPPAPDAPSAPRNGGYVDIPIVDIPIVVEDPDAGVDSGAAESPTEGSWPED